MPPPRPNSWKPSWNRCWKKRGAGKGHVFFVDAAHFVMGAFLCCVWCLVRLFIRGGSGRKRYSVLGAWNAVTHELVSITTDATVSADTMCALLRKIAALGLQGPITLVLDNARYQHCALVMDLAKSLNIHLEFLPSYSPNLNLIERLWKFIKKQVLYGKHYATFAEFCAAIDGCLAKIPTDHRERLNSLMTHNFQTASRGAGDPEQSGLVRGLVCRRTRKNLPQKKESGGSTPLSFFGRLVGVQVTLNRVGLCGDSSVAVLGRTYHKRKKAASSRRTPKLRRNCSRNALHTFSPLFLLNLTKFRSFKTFLTAYSADPHLS